MHKSSWLVFCLVGLPGCMADAVDCFEVPAATAELARGGWDRNGTSLRGGWDHNGTSLTGVWDRNGTSTRGGWDRNGTAPGAELEGVTLTDDAGVAIEVVRGRLLDAEGIERTEVSLQASTERGTIIALTAHLARVENEVALYTVEVEGVPVCEGAALFAEGRWEASGTHLPGGVTLACERGAIAKCALWGYAPWVVGEASHQACTRMVRADYCGDGRAWTRDGTLIDVTDPEGIQALAGGEEMTFEAGWNESGAVCVGASRYEVLGRGGERVLPPCWASLPRCHDIPAAYEAGALLANDTLHQTVPACR